jgi:hypothetical protein
MICEVGCEDWLTSGIKINKAPNLLEQNEVLPHFAPANLGLYWFMILRCKGATLSTPTYARGMIVPIDVPIATN